MCENEKLIKYFNEVSYFTGNFTPNAINYMTGIFPLSFLQDVKITLENTNKYSTVRILKEDNENGKMLLIRSRK